MAEGREKSFENRDSLGQESLKASETSSKNSVQCLAKVSMQDRSRCIDDGIGQEAEASHVIEATIKSADVSATAEVISSEIELSVHSGRIDTELPVQLDGDEKSKKLYLKETVNSETYEKKLPSMSEVETYDEITKSEVTSLDDWEDVQESCLSETPPVDPEALRDLESRANDIAGNLDHLLTSLGNNLKAMSHVSTECLDAYSTCVDHMSETVDVNVKAMYTLIARCEELNASLKPVQHMAEQIKDIKKTLDIFEALCK